MSLETRAQMKRHKLFFLFYMCAVTQWSTLFPMDLGKLMEKNSEENVEPEILLLDSVNLPSIVEMQEMHKSVTREVLKKIEITKNGSVSKNEDYSKEVVVEGEKRTLGNGFFGFVRWLFK